jgi:aminopeptidase
MTGQVERLDAEHIDDRQCIGGHCFDGERSGAARAATEAAIVGGHDRELAAERIDLWPPALADDARALQQEYGGPFPGHGVMQADAIGIEKGHPADDDTLRTGHGTDACTIVGMIFGTPSDDLMPGAHNAIDVCLAIQPHERVALIADDASAGVAAALERALLDRGVEPDCVTIERVASRPIRTAPREVLEALDLADAGILCVQPQEGELPARMNIVSVVERRRIRYAHMVGVTPRIMREGMRADYRLVDRLSQQLCDRMHSAGRLSVRTDEGTDFSAIFDPALAWVKTSGLINPRYWSNLPAGEVFTTPASVDGTFVCNGTAGDYFNAKYGSLERTPLTLEIRGGRLVSAQCPNADLQRDFWTYCHTDANSDRVGELAFGTNLGLREMIGILLQDEKVPGVHIAFGDPYGSQTHADWASRTHVDVLTRSCDVWIDDQQVIAKGQYLLDEFTLN